MHYQFAPSHLVHCPFCGHKWRTPSLEPILHCPRCNRDFPNPWAPVPEETGT